MKKTRLSLVLLSTLFSYTTSVFSTEEAPYERDSALGRTAVDRSSLQVGDTAISGRNIDIKNTTLRGDSAVVSTTHAVRGQEHDSVQVDDTAVTGRDVVLESGAQLSSDGDVVLHTVRGITATGASINVGGNLSLGASEGSINISRSRISVAGTLAMNAAGDINLTTVAIRDGGRSNYTAGGRVTMTDTTDDNDVV